MISDEYKVTKIFREYEGGNLDLWNMGITSLIGCPRVIHNTAEVMKELQQQFSGVASLLDGPFVDLSTNFWLTSLEGGPVECYRFSIENEVGVGLTSLEHAPMIVKGNFKATANSITNLAGIGKDYLKEVYGIIVLDSNPLESNFLGLMRVKGLVMVKLCSPPGEKLTTDKGYAETIINHYLLKGPDIMECQEELIQAGLKQFARL